MSFRVVIPARLGSTRLAGKALLDVGGKPMVVRVAERAALSGAAEIHIATDHQRILDVCREHGLNASLTRADHASGTDRLVEVVQQLGWADDEVVVNVQGDEPLIDPALIDAVSAMLEGNAEAVVSTACHPIRSAADFFNPNVVKVVLDRIGHALYFSRSPIPWARNAFAGQTVPALADGALPDGYPAYRHIGLYGYRCGFLRSYGALPQAPLETLECLEQLRVLWHGGRICVHVAPVSPEAGVDTQEDLERVRRAFEQGVPPVTLRTGHN